MTQVFRVAATRRERARAFSLCHEAYLRRGLLTPQPGRMRLLPHHLLSTTDVFIGTAGRQIVCTLSLARDGAFGLPMESTFAEEVIALRARGESIAEAFAFAAEPASATTIELLIGLIRAALQFGCRNGLGRLALVSHPRHLPVYSRLLPLETLGPPQPYPLAANQPATVSTMAVSECIADPAFAERYLTPTLPSAWLQSRPMDAHERVFFQQRVPAFMWECLPPMRTLTAA